jgi:hypothetical protein
MRKVGFFAKIALKLSSLKFFHNFCSRNIVNQLNKANVHYAATRDPFYEPYLLSPRFGVSGFNIRDYITSSWFKGDSDVAKWFLSWVFYRTFLRRIIKRGFHLSVVAAMCYLLITQVLFNDIHLFVKITGFIFFTLVILAYYALTSAPIYLIRQSIENHSSGLFRPEHRDIFLTQFFPQMPSSCYTTETFINLVSSEDSKLTETLELLHPEWFGSCSDLLTCAKTLIE